MTSIEPASIADRAGIGTAGACAIHCLIAPWLGSITPLIGAKLTDETAEVVFLGVSLAFSGLTLLVAGLRLHRQWRGIATFLGGAAVLIGARVSGLADDAVGPMLIVTGATLITGAHLLNIRCCREAAGCTSCAPAE
jgi:hypothetical protein